MTLREFIERLQQSKNLDGVVRFVSVGEDADVEYIVDGYDKTPSNQTFVFIKSEKRLYWQKPNDSTLSLNAGDRYDYANQAWMRDGKYLRCGHHEEHDCRCFGKAFQGCTPEQVQRIALEHGADIPADILPKPVRLHPDVTR